MKDARTTRPDQLLHLVFGGELESLRGMRFRDLDALDIVGIYPNYAEAYRWLAVCQNHAWAIMHRPMDHFRQQSVASARKAVELDPSLADD